MPEPSAALDTDSLAPWAVPSVVPSSGRIPFPSGPLAGRASVAQASVGQARAGASVVQAWADRAWAEADPVTSVVALAWVVAWAVPAPVARASVVVDMAEAVALACRPMVGPAWVAWASVVQAWAEVEPARA